MTISIARVSLEHHHDGFGISTPIPRISWRFDSSTLRDWKQKSYDITILRQMGEESYHVTSSTSHLVAWPSAPLQSRERAKIKVRATGEDGSSTEWADLAFEVALLQRSDWQAKLISGPAQDAAAPKLPIHLRGKVKCGKPSLARLYATAHGISHVTINGRAVGDRVLTPGWQSYKHRLHYDIYDITSLLTDGDNSINAEVGEGWFAGRLGRPGRSNIWGTRLGFLAQIEIDNEITCVTNSEWECSYGSVVESELYNGEVVDSTIAPQLSGSPTSSPSRVAEKAEELPFPSATLISPEVAPVRRVLELRPIAIITTPSNKKVLDFGQNVVGWLRIERDVPATVNNELIIRYAEVMEHDELGTRPLRTAKAQYTVKLGGTTKGLEPKFTFYGFRYAEITGWDAFTVDCFTAVVISSDLERTGTFECSHELINKLHENTLWSMRGNFVSVPTDCPQRDERLGWTGDLQVFAPTGSYMFDTTAFLSGWLRDLEADQRDAGGVVPLVIPSIPMTPDGLRQNRAMAVWADCSIITPWDLYQASGDKAILEVQWDSMQLWLDHGIPRNEQGFYANENPQFGDWLDPRAPPDAPGHGPTDSFLVANAYLIHVTALAGEIAKLLGKVEDSQRYAQEAERLHGLFLAEYMSPNGRLVSDTQTAYSIALRFGLIPEDHIAAAKARLDWLIRWEAFKITTGFAGTPVVLNVLADNDMLSMAYRMLQERNVPSWLYPVTMGATTIWERWNSMLPDGTINPGQMTSFNHYALGSVCHFLHSVVGGLSALTPGWRSALVRPRPGGTVRHAKTSFLSPYGPYAVSWRCEGDTMITQVSVPPNCTAQVVLTDVDVTVGSGTHTFESIWTEDEDWPPRHIQAPHGLGTENPSQLAP